MSAIWGSKPGVPNMPKLDLGSQQNQAISANAAALPGAEKLADTANTFSTDQITKMLNAAIPGYSGMAASSSKAIQSEIAGQIPQDVQDAEQNDVAAQALGSGTAGSGAHQNLLARDLGLTSLDLTNKGISSAESWMGQAAKIYEPGMTNASSMFITPEQQYQSTNQQNEQQFQQQWMQSQVNAAPDPVAVGAMDMATSVLGSARGGS